MVSRQRVFWAWHEAGEESTWEVPEIPRHRWSPTTPLCKLYLSTIEVSAEAPLQDNPVLKFGEVLFPELDILLSGTYKADPNAPKGDAKAKPAKEKTDEAAADQPAADAGNAGEAKPEKLADVKTDEVLLPADIGVEEDATKKMPDSHDDEKVLKPEPSLPKGVVEEFDLPGL